MGVVLQENVIKWYRRDYLSKNWDTDHVDILRVRGKRSLYSYVIKCKEHVKKNQIILMQPDTVKDSIIFEHYLIAGNCPLKDGILKTDLPNEERKTQFSFNDDVITYTVKWL